MVTTTTVQFGVFPTRATRGCMVIMGQSDEGSTGGGEGASDGKFQTKCDKYISGKKNELKVGME